MARLVTHSKLVWRARAAVERGSSFISAEHGIARLEAGEFAGRKGRLEIELTRRVKDALDPEGVLNPGVILAAGRG